MISVSYDIEGTLQYRHGRPDEPEGRFQSSTDKGSGAASFEQR